MLSHPGNRAVAKLSLAGTSLLIAIVLSSGSAGRQTPKPLGPAHRTGSDAFGLVTIGDGHASHGVFDVTDYTDAGIPDPATAIEVALSRGSRVILLRGTYRFVRPLAIDLSDFAIDADPGAVLKIANGSPVGLFDLSGDRVRLSGVELTIENAIPNQVAIRMTGANLTVERCRFEVTTPAGNAESPMIVLQFQGAVRKHVFANQWLPNAGVTCLQSIDGNGLSFLGNEIGNGADGGFPEGFATRACYRGLDLVRDEWCTISSNKFFGLGLPDIGKVDSALCYQGDATTEGGHLVITSNFFEAIASDHMIRLRACRWFELVGNVIGPPTSFPDELGEAAICVVGQDGAAGGEHSSGGVIAANDIHNSAKEDSDGCAIFLEAADDVAITGNNFNFQRSRHVIHVDSNTCRQASIAANRFMGWKGLGPMPISPLRLTDEPCDALFVGQNAFRGFSGGLHTGTPTGTKVFLRGLMDASDRMAPDPATKIEDLTTNCDLAD